MSAAGSVGEMLSILQSRIIMDLKRKYSDYADSSHLIFVMQDIFACTKRPFIILIDEWDCLFREYGQNEKAQKQYLDFLRAWLKDKEYVALAYMTGILPIKKYGSHSALNMFTEEEVRGLCQKHKMSFEEAKAWYDGYQLVTHTEEGGKAYSRYSPKSVVESMLRHKFGTYWNQTETYEALKRYIQMDMDGLKDAVVRMLAGERIPVNTGTFSNDMTTFAIRDDILTLLIHLGYLTYDSLQGVAAIPNREVSQEYVNAIRTMDWHEVMASVEASRRLLESLWAMDGKAVAEGIILLAGINYDRKTKAHTCVIEMVQKNI